ncbi:tyrosine-type recombinase/integrase [Actinotignum sanguinis]|nr:tyrosine-type recombinase/integrase [Actinotignum sanguinis]
MILQNISMEKLLESFEEQLKAARRSPNTIRLRLYYLRRIAARAELLAVTHDELVAWLANPGWSKATARSARTALVLFFKWCYESGRRADNPAHGLPEIGETPPCPHPTPEDAYAVALKASLPRVRLMLRLAGELGMRRAEVAQVHIQDLSQDAYGALLCVHGKGGKDRIIPLSAGLAREIRIACMKGGGYAFPSERGVHLSADYVGKLVARALPPGWSMHSLRHRFATRCWSETHDLLSVSQLLGHASTKTTQRYVANDYRRLREVARAAA